MRPESNGAEQHKSAARAYFGEGILIFIYADLDFVLLLELFVAISWTIEQSEGLKRSARGDSGNELGSCPCIDKIGID